jgi:hypothetical protein
MRTETTQSLQASKRQERMARHANRYPLANDATGRRERIAELAYRKAERRGFEPGNELADWLEAEAELDES